MNKPTKNIKNRIAYYAKMIPSELSNEKEDSVRWTGEDLLLTGMSEVEGEKIDPSKSYLLKIPTQVNHEEKMIKAYKSKGKTGVFDYLLRYLSDKQEYVNALRVEIFSSGSFEPYSPQEQYDNKLKVIRKNINALSDFQSNFKRVGDKWSVKVDEKSSQIIEVIADAKMIPGVTAEHKAFLDNYLNQAYEAKRIVLGLPSNHI